MLTLLSACGDIDIPNPMEAISKATIAKQGKGQQRVFGVVAGDDHAAVSAGAGVLSNGGSAADAAVAIGFAMSVTSPSRVGLGGGGLCLAGGGKSGRVQVLDFLPAAATSEGSHTDRPTAIPTFVRGMAALHARHGVLSWRDLIAPSRTFARDGVITTKMFAEDLAKYSVPLFADPISRNIFSNRKGKPFAIGERLTQLDLNSTLSTIYGRGAGEFYNGILAARLIEATKSAGGSLGAEELRNFLPRWRDAVSVQIGDNVFHAPPPPASAGVVAVQMLQLALAGKNEAEATPSGYGHLFLEAAKRSLTDRQKWLGSDFGASAQVQRRLSAGHAKSLMGSFSAGKASSVGKSSTAVPELDAAASFVVADGSGLVVACSLTMYHPFGTGRTAPGLGFFLAPAPGKKGRNPLSLGPVVVTNASNNSVRFAFSSSGGAMAATSMASVMFNSIVAKKDLRTALSDARLHYGSGSNEIVIEDREAKDRLVALISLGHKARRLPKIGRVNGIVCPDGLSSGRPSCDVEADPRGGGHAATINFLKQDQ